MHGTTGARLPSLDGLRGLAILIVLFTHGTMAFRTLSGPGLNAVISFGWVALDIFFVLSGFLITRILLDTRGDSRYYRVFYLRRALRILPLYYAFCFALFIILPWFAADPGSLRRAAPWYLAFAVNIRMALHGSGGAVLDTQLFWSLALEEQFYVLWPFLVAHLDGKVLRWICISTVPLSLLARIVIVGLGHPWGAYVLLPCRMGALGCGAWIAIASRDGRLPLRSAPAWLTISALCVCGIAALERTGYFFTPLMATIGSTVVTFMCASLLLLAMRDGPAQRILASRVLLSLGKYSYGLYLFDWVSVQLAWRVFGVSDAARAVMGRLLFSIAVDILLALLSWHLLEKKFLALQKHVPYGFAGRKSTQPAKILAPEPCLGSPVG